MEAQTTFKAYYVENSQNFPYCTERRVEDPENHDRNEVEIGLNTGFTLQETPVQKDEEKQKLIVDQRVDRKSMKIFIGTGKKKSFPYSSKGSLKKMVMEMNASSFQYSFQSLVFTVGGPNPFSPLTDHLRSDPDLNNELIRLSTFSRYTGQSFRIKLARAGFYCTSSYNVRCYLCGFAKNDWVCDDNPLFIHQNASPNCCFFRRNEDVNVPISHKFREILRYASNVFERGGVINDQSPEVVCLLNWPLKWYRRTVSDTDGNSEGNSGMQSGIVGDRSRDLVVQNDIEISSKSQVKGSSIIGCVRSCEYT